MKTHSSHPAHSSHSCAVDLSTVASMGSFVQIGRGGQATVLRSPGSAIAVKIFDKTPMTGDADGMRRAWRCFQEDWLMRTLPKHSCLVSYVGSCPSTSVWDFAYWMEYMPMSLLQVRNELSVLRSKTCLQPYLWTFSMRVARNVLSALSHLHRNGVVHRDVKIDNVLVDASGSVKLCDLGFACCHVSMTEGNESGGGAKVFEERVHFSATSSYTPPELCHDRVVAEYLDVQCAEAIDVWGAGIVAVEMLLGRRVMPELGRVDRARVGAARREMLRAIFETVGPPREDYLTVHASSMSEKTRDMVRDVIASHPQGWLRSQLVEQAEASGSSEASAQVDAIMSMLSIDPRKRPSASDALRCFSSCGTARGSDDYSPDPKPDPIRPPLREFLKFVDERRRNNDDLAARMAESMPITTIGSAIAT